MAYTLFDLTYMVARELRVVFEGTATGGAVNQVADTLWLTSYNDDHFNRGGVWILRDAGGAGAAPENEYQRVLDFTQSTGLITTAGNWSGTSAVAAGDRYAVCNEQYPLDILIQCINEVLTDIRVPTTNITTITTAGSKTEYDLPAAVLDEDIEVYMQQVTSDTDDNAWLPWHGWYIEETGTGVAKKLIFLTQPPYTRAVKIVYYLPHAELLVNTDKLREGVNVSRVVLDSALRCLLWKAGQKGTADAVLTARITELQSRVERMKWVNAPNRYKTKLATLGDIDQYGERLVY